MWDFCKVVGGIAIICGGIVFVVWGVGYGILTLEYARTDYQAKVDLDTYGSKFDGYVKVCLSNGVPATVCVLAWPNGARK